MATWNAAYNATPAASALVTEGDDRIRELKDDIYNRIKNEHYIDTDSESNGSQAQDWWHREGSAKVYYAASAPTTRPDGTTSLDSTDEGRVWVDSDNETLSVYSGGSWVNVVGSTTYLKLSTSQTITGVKDFSTAPVFSAGITMNSKTLSYKILSIGDWDMNTTANITIPFSTHGVTLSNVRSCQVVIRGDSNSGSYPDHRFDLIGGVQAGGNSEGAWNLEVPTGTIRLRRWTGGDFDGFDFDATSYNRGWIHLWYEE